MFLLFGLLILVICFIGYSVLCIFLWYIIKSKIGKRIVIAAWCAPIILIALGILIDELNEKKILDKEDYHGKYIIDRRFFKGKESDWQYNSYRFEITDDDSIFFHCTQGSKILQTYRGRIGVTQSYQSARLIIEMPLPTYHVLESNPTIYRSAWNFYLVFNSKHYHNMYFRKGKWKPLK